MTTFLLVVSLAATLASIGAGVTFLVKKVRRQWIPNAVFVVWGTGAAVSFLAHAYLDNWARAAMNAVVMACAVGCWVLHQISRQRA